MEIWRQGWICGNDPVNIEVMEPEFVRKYCHETEIFRSEPCFLEVVSKNVDKAYSLKHLLRILGIPREEIVCCGDSFNDISMIQFAGLGVFSGHCFLRSILVFYRQIR